MILTPLAMSLLLATRWYWAPRYPGRLPADPARQGVYVCDKQVELPLVPPPALGETAYTIDTAKVWVWKGVGTGWVELAGGGGGGAPTDAQYWVGAADSTLTQEKNLGALGTGLVINTAGTPSAYLGSTCPVDQYAILESATGVLSCSQVAYSQLSGAPTIPTDLSAEPYITYSASSVLSAERILTSSPTVSVDSSSTVTLTVLTPALDLFTQVLRGLVPPSSYATTHSFLRADGQWADPLAPGLPRAKGLPKPPCNAVRKANWQRSNCQ